MVEAGLLRSKNTQSIIMQVMAGMVVLGFMWDIVGYSLTFGDDHGGVIGDFKHSFLLGVGYNECSPHAPQIPAALYALFMMMFAAITPLLMTGTFLFTHNPKISLFNKISPVFPFTAF